MRVVSGYRTFTLCTVKFDTTLILFKLQINDKLFPLGFDLCKIGNIWRCFLCRWPENRARKALSFHTSLLIDTNRVRNKQKWNYVCNAQKNLTLLYVREKISNSRDLGKKFLLPG